MVAPKKYVSNSREAPLTKIQYTRHYQVRQNVKTFGGDKLMLWVESASPLNGIGLSN